MRDGIGPSDELVTTLQERTTLVATLRDPEIRLPRATGTYLQDALG